MSGRLDRTGGILPAEGFHALQGAKRNIQDAAVGKLPEQLVLTAVRAALRCAQVEERTLTAVVSKNVAALVREALKGLEREPEWKPDTVLKMVKPLTLRIKLAGPSFGSGHDER